MSDQARHPADGRLHLSELKQLRKSPAHYLHACRNARDVTRPMLVGSTADCMVFGGRGYAVYPGKVRHGKEWELFRAEHHGRFICLSSEHDEARGAAEAVLADPIARELLDGCEFQRVVQWETGGFRCGAGIPGERGGFDAYRPPTGARNGQIHDLKVTSSADPDELQRHALKMLWHVQGAWYLDGAAAVGMRATEFRLICVESSAPHAVTVLRVPDALLDMGRRSIRMWLERLRACEAADEWPGYVQSEVEMELPEWMMVGECAP